MLSSSASPGLSEQWFLKEKAALSLLLDNECGELSVEEFSVLAQEKISLFLKYDFRSSLERAVSFDTAWEALLDMLRNNLSLYLIARELKKDLGLNVSPQQCADILRLRFPKEYELYLKRMYLSLFIDEITYILVEYHSEPVDEQFYLFLKEFKSSAVFLEIGVEEFKFVTNFTCPLSPRSPKMKASALLLNKKKLK